MATLVSRMSVNAGKNSSMKSGKGHFASSAQRLAKLRSGYLQHGVPRHAPLGGLEIGGTKKPAKSGKMKTSPAQFGLNPKQQ